jgi:hypothetical protein
VVIRALIPRRKFHAILWRSHGIFRSMSESLRHLARVRERV